MEPSPRRSFPQLPRDSISPRSGCLLLLAGLVLLLVGAGLRSPLRSVQAQSAPTPLALPNSDAVCAQCHATIYSSYERTPMARGSGTALAGFIPGAFHHQASDVEYRIFERNGEAWMSYTRPASSPGGELSGERQLRYFIGSGHRGRTFLYEIDGLWFELPINFYSVTGKWDMAPAFGSATRMPAPLPIEPNCLHCHATGIASTLSGARNRFNGAPFSQGGIGCSSCHGDPHLHLAMNGEGPILNPAKLPPARRDSTCIQCHLEGDAVVFRAGRSLAQFRPGDDLGDYALYFVRSSQATGGARGTSQYEALLKSACKRASGDRLTCTTCHDPHASPSPTNQVSYFRARCLSCHTSPALARTHHPEQPDCAACHMPSLKTADISHEQVTDHNIERYPAQEPSAHGAPLAPGETLIAVGDASFGDRELGLAYAQLAQRGDRIAGEHALQLLTRAEKAGNAGEQVHLNLGFLDQISSHPSEARNEYIAALDKAPFEPAAVTDLAVLDAGSGQLAEAIALLQRLVNANPAQTAAGLDLAFLQCKLGHTIEARAVTQRLLKFNPDSAQLRAFVLTGTYAGRSCPAMLAPTVP